MKNQSLVLSTINILCWERMGQDTADTNWIRPPYPPLSLVCPNGRRIDEDPDRPRVCVSLRTDDDSDINKSGRFDKAVTQCRDWFSALWHCQYKTKMGGRGGLSTKTPATPTRCCWFSELRGNANFIDWLHQVYQSKFPPRPSILSERQLGGGPICLFCRRQVGNFGFRLRRRPVRRSRAVPRTCSAELLSRPKRNSEQLSSCVDLALTDWSCCSAGRSVRRLSPVK